jgi:[ribosomal protein S18]-alanine N-acetyltransferase
VAVHPSHRRRGAGSALAAAAVGAAPPGGCALLEVAAGNPAAIATYKAAGFRKVGLRRAYYKDGSDAVLMRADVGGGGSGGGVPPGKGRGELPVL